MTTFATPAAQVQRDRYKRPLIIPPGGGKPKAYRRCTRFIDVLDDRYKLEQWKQRQVAHGLALRDDLLLKAASANGDRDLLDRVVEDAKEASKSSAAATSGTALHKITEGIDRGEDPLVPPSVRADVEAYKQATAHLTMRLIEVFVVNDDLGVGGTFDRLLELDGVLYIADVKTGRIDFGASKIAMQEAIYSRSQLYNPATGERTPLNADTSRGLVIHLPVGEGRCELQWADLDAGWEGVQLAAQVWRWRQRRGLLDASPPVDALSSDALHECISVTTHRAQLEALWADNEHAWTPDHTEHARQRLQDFHPEPGAEPTADPDMDPAETT